MRKGEKDRLYLFKCTSMTMIWEWMKCHVFIFYRVSIDNNEDVFLFCHRWPTYVWLIDILDCLTFERLTVKYWEKDCFLIVSIISCRNCNRHYVFRWHDSLSQIDQSITKENTRISCMWKVDCIRWWMIICPVREKWLYCVTRRLIFDENIILLRHDRNRYQCR